VNFCYYYCVYVGDADSLLLLGMLYSSFLLSSHFSLCGDLTTAKSNRRNATECSTVQSRVQSSWSWTV